MSLYILLIDDTEMSELENRVFGEIEFLDTKCYVGIQSLLAYVKHLKGQNEEAPENLKEADLIQGEHANQSDMRGWLPRAVMPGCVITWAGWQKPRFTWRRWGTLSGSLPVPPAIE